MSVHLGVGTHHDHTGMPMMGSAQANIDVSVDVHDTGNMPFAMLQQLFDMANGATRDKIKDVKIDYWQDESQADAICTYKFRGWVSQYSIGSGGDSNHVLHLSLQPALDQKQFHQDRDGQLGLGLIFRIGVIACRTAASPLC